MRKIINPDTVTLFPSGDFKGRVLFSYLAEPLLWKDSDPRFGGHTNKWKSWKIAKIFQGLGYAVDAIEWTDHKFEPEKSYDVIFDIHANLQRLTSFNARARKILYLTGSYVDYQNSAELERLKELKKRKGVRLVPRRFIRDAGDYKKSLALADYCLLAGNENTHKTFPKRYRGKIHPISNPGSHLGWRKSRGAFVPVQREFLWFSGGGAVHKGLDLVLEVFSAKPYLVLNVVGPVDHEQDFFDAYREELTRTTNIRYHGFLDPSSEEFREIVSRVFCFVAPSCSEGASSAVLTCLEIGIFPILSRDTGVSLPRGSGFFLRDLSIGEIGSLVDKAYQIPKDELTKRIDVVQNFVLKQHSKEKFSEDIKQHIIQALKMND
ncbi:hypothetical protein GTO10_05295 [Candidatus Saccharibacteria bacterium]|nr:hypothetical protein [Candidatus Saccharibacteria bacterium]